MLTRLIALCILIGQIQYERFYCSHEDLISSRSETTLQCNIQGKWNYVSSSSITSSILAYWARNKGLILLVQSCLNWRTLIVIIVIFNVSIYIF